jgi:hypothetical protein
MYTNDEDAVTRTQEQRPRGDIRGHLEAGVLELVNRSGPHMG